MSAEETDKVSNFIDEISGLQKVAFARARFDYTNLVSLFKTSSEPGASRNDGKNLAMTLCAGVIEESR